MAEVPSGSSPFVLFSGWGLFVTLPLYLLHTVFLAGVVHRYADGLRLESLYLAGALYGLYEAYLTKVIWAPTWDPIPITVGGIYPFETGLLILFWHPVVSFIIPLLLVERLATRSGLVLDGLPTALRSRVVAPSRRVPVAGLLALAAMHGAVAASPADAVASAIGVVAATGAVLLAWRRWVGPDRYPLDALLPTGRELAGLGALLGGLYLVLGVGLRPAFLPGLPAQATVWVLYLVFGGLLSFQLRRDRRFAGPTPTHRPLPLRPAGHAAAGYVVAVGVASIVLSPVVIGVYLALNLLAVFVGGGMLLRVGRGVWPAR